ncbi:MAG: efflux RND transporter periplasmic adaptor subunit [Saprospiraceae bacterium]|nr:efflux RND transporter periplasmic adaptor subunit [Saprospiraceae bacterium]
MKTYYILFILTMSLLWTACGGNPTAEKADPSKLTDLAEAKKMLKEKRDELRKVKGDIALIEAFIEEKDPSAKKEKIVPVTTTPIIQKTFQHFVQVQGNVATAQDPAVASSETGGRLIEMTVKQGDYVKQGDLIAKVDLESIRKSIEELEKSMELARDIYSRQKNLWEKNIGSEVQYLQAKNQVESLEKTKERMEFELTKANVYAPASGHVENVMVKAGEMAGPGSPIVQILNSSSLKVVAAVPEIYLGKVKRGRKVKIEFPAINTEQQASITMLGRMINPTNRTFEVEASLANKGGLLKPNLLATMYIEDYRLENAIVLSDEFILQDVSGDNYVMVVENGKAVRKNITVGKSYMNESVVESGLSGQEIVIAQGSRQANEGDKVKVLTDTGAVAQNSSTDSESGSNNQ